jgi:hypothetical protein
MPYVCAFADAHRALGAGGRAVEAQQALALWRSDTDASAHFDKPKYLEMAM